MANQGFFIVLEGSDGAGKGTQFRLLAERLKAVGYDVEVFDFPRYEHESSYFVRRYLNGDYGPADKISPYSASLFFALARFEAADKIRNALAEGKIVLANRYVGSNMAHMGAKIKDPLEQRSFFVWEDSLEFQLLKLPRPNMNIFLKVPAEISYELIAKKDARSYTAKNRDEHESDMEHLRSAVDTYSLLCQLFPSDFIAIDCVQDGELMSIPDINNRIWSLIKPMLPSPPSENAHKVTLSLSETIAEKSQAEPASSGQKYTAEVSAQLLLQIEASQPNLMNYELDWKKTNYAYLPLELAKKVQAEYKQGMEELVTLYKKMNSKSASRTLPRAALIKVSFQLNTDQQQALANTLSSINSPEALALLQKVGGKAQIAGPKKVDAEPEAITEILSRLAETELSKKLAAEVEPVRLVQALPRNEFSTLTDIIYPYSNLPREEIDALLESWTYQQKYQTLRSAVLTGASSSGLQTQYKLDIVGDYLTILSLVQAGVAQEVHMQPATPRYGYEVPAELAEQGLEDDFLSCFDKSLELFSQLQATGKDSTAAYATLLGHKQRFQIIISLDTLKAALQTKDKELRALLEQIVEKISEAHPVIGASLTEEPAEELPKPTKPSQTKKSSHRRRRRGNRSKKP